MTKKHITALGVPFDMASLRTKNEKVRAVGNMNVNARGDVIDSNNNVINDSNKRVNVMYQKTMQPPKELPTATAKQQPDKGVSKYLPGQVSASELDQLDDDVPNPKK